MQEKIHLDLQKVLKIKNILNYWHFQIVLIKIMIKLCEDSELRKRQKSKQSIYV